MHPRRISPCLWFNGQGEAAARFYASLFPDSGIDRITPGPTGEPLVIDFHLAGVPFQALNGGPEFQFNEAISLSVQCDDQLEIDDLWNKLTADGTESQCGWLKDRYGLSWQIVPAILPRLFSDPARAGAVMQALMTMRKLDIAQLQAAFDGAATARN